MSFNEKLAKLVVHYAVDVQPKDLVFILGSEITSDLIRAIYIEIMKVKAYPVVHIKLSGLNEIALKYLSDEQLDFFDPRMILLSEKADKMINIFAEVNTKSLGLADPEKLRKIMSRPKALEFQKTLNRRELEGKFHWVVAPYPCNALAQEAGMGLYAYKEFIEEALGLKKEDPVQYWKNIEKEQQKIVDYLDQVERIHVLGEDTDLTLSTKGRTWVNCCGHVNLPDGEVFTGPVENSINGHIRFTYPGIYMGKEIENIYLEFKDGKVVKGTASKGQDLLDNILKIDGANGIGEFAIGTNYNIKKFTKSMLFDEKMGGTLHMALGLGIPETGSKSVSAIHWDILKDMKNTESKIFADDKLIYEAGEWKI